MSTPPPDLDALPEALAAPRRGWQLPLVWIIPLVAAIVGGWLAVQNVLQRGPVATIRFATAEGLEAGKTRVKFKDVEVGEVRRVALAGDLDGVIVTVQFVKDAEKLLVEDTRFWVVRPRVSGAQVSGLGTLLSGSHIGLDVGRSAVPRRDFPGLETPPIVIGDEAGRRFSLTAADLGSLDIGSPLYFRRVPAGRVVGFAIAPDGQSVGLEVFVARPFDRFVTDNTRFWQASGVDVQLDADGLRVDTQSVVAIVTGGVAFEQPADEPPGRPAAAGARFALHPDRTAAMRAQGRERVLYKLYFNESLRGLAPGAPVDFRGVVMGEVRSIGTEWDIAAGVYRFPVMIALYPERLQPRRGEGEAAEATTPLDGARARDIVAGLVSKGFRAQLRTANYLTGRLYVALDFFERAEPVVENSRASPPVLPTVKGSFEELQLTLASVARKLDALPLEQLGEDVRKAVTSLNATLDTARTITQRVDERIAPRLDDALSTLNRTLDSAERAVSRVDADLAPAAQAAIGDARRTLSNVDRTLDPTRSPLMLETRDALRELRRAAQSLRTLADSLERHPESLLRGRPSHEP